MGIGKEKKWLPKIGFYLDNEGTWGEGVSLEALLLQEVGWEDTLNYIVTSFSFMDEVNCLYSHYNSVILHSTSSMMVVLYD